MENTKNTYQIIQTLPYEVGISPEFIKFCKDNNIKTPMVYQIDSGIAIPRVHISRTEVQNYKENFVIDVSPFISNLNFINQYGLYITEYGKVQDAVVKTICSMTFEEYNKLFNSVNPKTHYSEWPNFYKVIKDEDTNEYSIDDYITESNKISECIGLDYDETISKYPELVDKLATYEVAQYISYNGNGKYSQMEQPKAKKVK